MAIRYNFSAFVAAARSPLQYACKKFEVSNPTAKAWYDSYVGSNSFLQLARKIRNVEIHENPTPRASVTAHVDLAASCFIVGQGESATIEHRETPIAVPTARQAPFLSMP
jgi:hypothetical protein